MSLKAIKFEIVVPTYKVIQVITEFFYVQSSVYKLLSSLRPTNHLYSYWDFWMEIYWCKIKNSIFLINYLNPWKQRNIEVDILSGKATNRPEPDNKLILKCFGPQWPGREEPRREEQNLRNWTQEEVEASWLNTTGRTTRKLKLELAFACLV